jgi:energy-coupling factor transport system substrate-specific component
MKNRLLFYVFIAGIILNVSGYYLGKYFTIQTGFFLFLDSTGTLFAAILLGPLTGAATGLTSNLILGVTDNLVNIPFAAVNVITGITAGIISANYGFRNIKSLLICILAVTVLNAFFGAIISFYVFGGISGGRLDLNMVKFMDAGIFISSFLVRIPVNLIDKSISSIAAFFIAIKVFRTGKDISWVKNDR